MRSIYTLLNRYVSYVDICAPTPSRHMICVRIEASNAATFLEWQRPVMRAESIVLFPCLLLLCHCLNFTGHAILGLHRKRHETRLTFQTSG